MDLPDVLPRAAGLRVFNWKDAIISDLQSPEENSRGYLLSAIATALTGVFFLQLLRIFHGWLRSVSAAGTFAGSTLFGLGAAGAMAVGILAPFPHSYDAVHIPLAFATFIFLVAGTGVYLFLASLYFRSSSRVRSLSLLLSSFLTLGILGVLGWLYVTPDFFTGESLLTTLALWEWLLCASIVGLLLMLATSAQSS